MGATALYHGQFVWLEWQSPQDRLRMSATSGGTDRLAAISFFGSTIGLILDGRKTWITASRTTTARARRLNHDIIPPATVFHAQADRLCRSGLPGNAQSSLHRAA